MSLNFTPQETEPRKFLRLSRVKTRKSEIPNSHEDIFAVSYHKPHIMPDITVIKIHMVLGHWIWIWPLNILFWEFFSRLVSFHIDEFLCGSRICFFLQFHIFVTFIAYGTCCSSVASKMSSSERDLNSIAIL